MSTTRDTRRWGNVRPFPWTKAIALVALMGIGAALPAPAEEKVLLWGDTHVHTHYSTDSFIQQNFETGPDAAYRFARGLPVRHPATGTRVRIETPLDFLVVSDHAESYGIMRRATLEGLPRDGLGPVDRVKSWAMEKFFRYLAENPGSVSMLLEMASAETMDVVEAARTPASMRAPNDELVARETWAESTTISDLHNDPGTFTTLIGWEWSAIPAGSNLHRVVFTSADAQVAQQFTPFSSSVSSYPEDLWAWLEETSARTGADFVAIPHNSNISRGFMFPRENRLRDTRIDREWITRRARWERAVEATQIKGDSETHPLLSPDDEFADFERYPHYISPKPLPYAPEAGDFVRSALRRGLEIEGEFGENPYRFGLIGSTDSHTGLATAEEPNFWGKFPTDSVLEGKLVTTGGIDNFGWAMSASGLAAVWAEENTREGIFEAFQRGEVYATTGTRITLRVRAISNADSNTRADELVRSKGLEAVPMGGLLTRQERPPALLIEASKDPKGANLERVQVVKGWLVGDETFERVYDVARAGEGAMASLADASASEAAQAPPEQGSASLSVLWSDPDFEAEQPAFYYVRVLEVPTPRHSTLDAIALGRDPETTGHPVTIQERAYGSPIHYRP